jgi:hypothetical protein
MCLTNRYSRRTSNRAATVAIAVIALAAQFALGGLPGAPFPKPAQKAAVLTNSLPSKVVTTDGVTYRAVKLSRIEPDGLVVEFQPDTGGTGIAKLKYARLPEPLQKQFGYDRLKAAAYEKKQLLAMTALSQKLRQDEKTEAAVLAALTRPNFSRGVIVKSSDPTVTYAYYDPSGPKPAQVGDHVGVLHHDFTFHADFDLEPKQTGAGRPVNFRVVAVTITLGLSCNIIQPDHPLEKGRIHEEGHRKIYEYFYQFAPKVAQRIAESMIDREFVSHTTDIEAGNTEVLREAECAAISAYLVQIDQPARAANRFYDQLTDHARNNVDSDQAAQEAIAKFSENLSN